MKNGTIMILGADEKNIGRKVFDLKIIQTFPILTTESSRTVLFTNGKQVNIDGYQHLSIPPDLNLHLTKSTGHSRHLNFETDLVDIGSGELKVDFMRLFTWSSQPISNYGQPIGKWFGAQLIFPFKDMHFTDRTGIFVDFFVHREPRALELAKNYPFLRDNMRYAGDNSGCTTGPYRFNEIVRGNHKTEAKFLFTIKFGYHENANEYATLDLPFQAKPE